MFRTTRDRQLFVMPSSFFSLLTHINDNHTNDNFDACHPYHSREIMQMHLLYTWTPTKVI